MINTFKPEYPFGDFLVDFMFGGLKEYHQSYCKKKKGS